MTSALVEAVAAELWGPDWGQLLQQVENGNQLCRQAAEAQRLTAKVVIGIVQDHLK